MGLTVRYVRAPRLLEDLRVAHGGGFARRLTQLARIDLPPLNIANTEPSHGLVQQRSDIA